MLCPLRYVRWTRMALLSRCRWGRGRHSRKPPPGYLAGGVTVLSYAWDQAWVVALQ